MSRDSPYNSKSTYINDVKTIKSERTKFWEKEKTKGQMDKVKYMK